MASFDDRDGSCVASALGLAMAAAFLFFVLRAVMSDDRLASIEYLLWAVLVLLAPIGRRDFRGF